jgi:glutaredoxin
LRVVLYTRQGCHLCADAHQVLEEARQRHGFGLESVDIDTDPELVDRYGEQVPVVLVDGKLRFRGTVNRVLLERLLGAEAKRIGQDSNPDRSGADS